MTPIGWTPAPLVWGCAGAWFFGNDAIKLVAHRMLDPREPALLAPR